MLTLDKLRTYGANVEEGLGRCLNNGDFYIRLVNKALEDKGIDRLKEAVDNGDRKAAFDAAHALKGMLANLALSPLSEPASELTELLRGEGEADPAVCAEYTQKLTEARDRLIALRDSD